MTKQVPMQSTGKICDECGKIVPKIWRVYKSQKYCSTCYAREFKRAMCPQCGNYAKLHRCHPEAVCSDCEKDKPCVRCGRPPKFPIGKITQYGPVCNACSPYFRPEESCEVCGAPSNRLSRIAKLGHDLSVCPKCARITHGTCQACRKHRALSLAPDGRQLCKKCLELGEISCPECKAPMPAGCGVKCESCQKRHAFEKKLKIDQAVFSTSSMCMVFSEFGYWLLAKVGSHKASTTIHRYLPFFLEIEKHWKYIPDYPELLKHFGAEGLRRMRLPMKWVEEAWGVMPDPQLREDDSDMRRIVTILDSVPSGSAAGEVLRKYHRMLQARLEVGETSIRSIRLALRAAASLIFEAGGDGMWLPNQSVLLRNLRRTPGQRAAVTGFVNFLNQKYEFDLLLPKAKKGTSSGQRRRLEAEMLDLMRESGERSDIDRRWLSVGLAYFHGLPRKAGLEVLDKDVELQADGIVVEWGAKKFWLPPRSYVMTH